MTTRASGGERSSERTYLTVRSMAIAKRGRAPTAPVTAQLMALFLVPRTLLMYLVCSVSLLTRAVVVFASISAVWHLVLDRAYGAHISVPYRTIGSISCLYIFMARATGASLTSDRRAACALSAFRVIELFVVIDGPVA